MSRIGKMPIDCPGGVDVALVDPVTVRVKGPKGELRTDVPDGITVEIDGSTVRVQRATDQKRHRALHGLVRALIANSVTGVSKGFTRELDIIGVGYRAALEGSSLTLNLGYSHPIHFPIPKEITIKVEKNTHLTIEGADKQQVGQIAAEIRALRPPEPYKGKGIRYSDETVRRKAGKSGA